MRSLESGLAEGARGRDGMTEIIYGHPGREGPGPRGEREKDPEDSQGLGRHWQKKLFWGRQRPMNFSED